jgi:glycosyltransferase involved in cell wall biosynthesis
MNIISKNNYIRLPTQESENYKQIKSQSKSHNINNQKETSKLVKQLILFNIISSIIIISIIVYFSIKLTDEKWEYNRDLRYEILKGFEVKEKHKDYIINCLQGKLLEKDEKLRKSKYPKISIIIPVYNKQNFILRILRSIQNQSLKDLEIIFTDDNSKDNSIDVIEKYQNEDPRIKLIKHNKNIGTLINRNEGARNSKGEYLLFIDSDDLLLKDILNKTYLIATENKLDILQFRAYWGPEKYLDDYYKYDDYGFRHKTSIITQPELSKLMYYEYEHENKTLQTEYNLWGKLIKRDIFLKTLKNISEYYLSQHMSLHEDGLILFILFKVATSYLFLEEFGMFYVRNYNSSLANLRKDENINKTVRDSFLYLKFMFEYTGNTVYEKNMAVYQFKFILSQFEKIFNKLTSGFDFIYKVIIMYLDCNEINDKDKEIFRKVMFDIETVERKNKG